MWAGPVIYIYICITPAIPTLNDEKPCISLSGLQQSSGEQMLPEAAESFELHGSSSLRQPEAAPAGERGAARGAWHRQPRGRNQRSLLTRGNHTGCYTNPSKDIHFPVLRSSGRSVGPSSKPGALWPNRLQGELGMRNETSECKMLCVSFHSEKYAWKYFTRWSCESGIRFSSQKNKLPTHQKS